MPKRLIVVGALVAVLLIGLVAWYFLTRSQPSDEQRIYGLVAQAQQAVEKRNSRGLTSLISRDYIDKSGVTRQQMVAMIVDWMRRPEQVSVVPEVTGLHIEGLTASMEVRVRAWYGSETSGAGQEYGIKAGLRKEGRDWKVISAEGWEEAQSDVMSRQ